MGRVVLSNRERPIIVQPWGKGLLGVTLRDAHELRSDAEYLADIPEFSLPDQLLGLADHIITAMTANFDPAYLEDRYRTILVSMLREKQMEPGKRASPAAPSRQNVISLMDVLKRSVAAQGAVPVLKSPARGGGIQSQRHQTLSSQNSLAARTLSEAEA
jgi:DNA end-binding protein Ku